MTDPKPTTKPLDMSTFLVGSKTAPKGDIVLHGPYGHGKTTCAATASDHLAKIETLPAPKLTALEDMLWIPFDTGALDGFAELNIELPMGNVIDGKGILDSGKPGMKARELITFVGDVIRKNSKIKWIVTDTVSQFDRVLSSYYIELHKDNNNSYAPYKDLLNIHRVFHTGISKLGKRRIWILHSAAQNEQTDAAGSLKKRAMAQPGGDPIIPDITGKARAIYIGNRSLELPVLAAVEPGSKGKKVEYAIYPYGHQSFEGSNRHHQILEYKEPAHLGKLLAKIEKGRAK